MNPSLLCQDSDFTLALNRLRDALVHEAKFDKVMDLFLGEVATSDGFLDAGTPFFDDTFEYAIRTTAKSLWADITIRSLRVVYLHDARFRHGMVEVKGGSGIVFFFDNEGRGLLALRKTGSDAILYSRFTLVRPDILAFPFNAYGGVGLPN